MAPWWATLLRYKAGGSPHGARGREDDRASQWRRAPGVRRARGAHDGRLLRRQRTGADPAPGPPDCYAHPDARAARSDPNARLHARADRWPVADGDLGATLRRG